MHKEFFSPFPIVDQPEADNNRLKSSLLALICILAGNYANEGIETFNFAETSPVSQKQNILTAVDNSISNGNYFLLKLRFEFYIPETGHLFESCHKVHFGKYCKIVKVSIATFGDCKLGCSPIIELHKL